MLIKAGYDFDSPRRVMQLMAEAPKELGFMPRPMPPIINKG